MKNVVIFFICLFVGTIAIGQTSINTSGGEVKNTFGSVSFSMGQVAYLSVSNSNGSVSQGVQQAYQISTLNLNEKEFDFSLSAYPNPTQDNLNLRVGNYHQEQLLYRLLDTEGKLLSISKVQSEQTIIEMQHLTTATYFVEVCHEGKKVQSFKVIKNQ
jgi:hypothetical protein